MDSVRSDEAGKAGASTAAASVALQKVDSGIIGATPKQRTSAGTFSKGNTLQSRGKRKEKSIVAYLHAKVGRDAHKVLDVLVHWATNSAARINGRPVPASIRLKAAEMILERHSGKARGTQEAGPQQPMFNLPPGASVAIRVDVPK